MIGLTIRAQRFVNMIVHTGQTSPVSLNTGRELAAGIRAFDNQRTHDKAPHAMNEHSWAWRLWLFVGRLVLSFPVPRQLAPARLRQLLPSLRHLLELLAMGRGCTPSHVPTFGGVPKVVLNFSHSDDPSN